MSYTQSRSLLIECSVETTRSTGLSPPVRFNSECPPRLSPRPLATQSGAQWVVLYRTMAHSMQGSSPDSPRTQGQGPASRRHPSRAPACSCPSSSASPSGSPCSPCRWRHDCRCYPASSACCCSSWPAQPKGRLQLCRHAYQEMISTITSLRFRSERVAHAFSAFSVGGTRRHTQEQPYTPPRGT